MTGACRIGQLEADAYPLKPASQNKFLAQIEEVKQPQGFSELILFQKSLRPQLQHADIQRTSSWLWRSQAVPIT
jgi:hypothetical protein